MEIETEFIGNNSTNTDINIGNSVPVYWKDYIASGFTTTTTNSTGATNNSQDTFITYSTFPSSQDDFEEYSNNNSYFKRKREQEEYEEDQDDEDEAPFKFYKHSHKQPETRDLPSCRLVKVQFRDRLLADGKVILKESWGVQVIITCENPELEEVKKGSKWWTKWTGRCSPIVSIPIVEAIHSVQTS